MVVTLTLRVALLVASLVAAIVIVSGIIIVTTSNTSTDTSTNINTTYTSTSALGSNGLLFSVSENASQISPNSAIYITISEFNTLDSYNNISVANNWKLPSILDWLSCPMDRASIPMYFAIYSGYFAMTNISSATPVSLYPYWTEPACPKVQVSFYDFQPSSGLLDGGASFSASQVVSGYYNVPTQTTSTTTVQTTITSFSQGIFTIAAGDEWGNLQLIYFNVS